MSATERVINDLNVAKLMLCNPQLTPEMRVKIGQAIAKAIDLLKKREPVEPIAIKQEMFDEFYGAVSYCPKCDCLWIMYRENDMHYCPECGQAVKWE